ncbi:MAG: hypothetical protein ACTSRK_03565 [Promethearchaeota archaeon]
MGEQYMLPSDKAEELILEYMRLLNDPKPEEEEQIHHNFLTIFGDLQNSFPNDSSIRQDISRLFQLIKEWDPLDYWFQELKILPGVMQNFFETYYQNEGLISDADADETTNGSETIQNNEDLEEKVKNQERIDKRIDLLKIQMQALKEKAVVLPPKKKKLIKNENSPIPSEKPHQNIALQAPVIQIPPMNTTPKPTPISKATTPVVKPSIQSSSPHSIQSSNIQTTDTESKPDQEPPKIVSVSKEEIEEMMDIDQKLNGSSIISNITIHKSGENSEEIIYQNDAFLQTNIQNDVVDEMDKIDEKTKDPEKVYQDLLRMRGKLTYFRNKRAQIATNFKNGLISQKHFDKFENQNQKEIQKLGERIQSIRSTLSEELALD